MNSKFLNATAHNLTEKQKEVVKGRYDCDVIDDLKDVDKTLFDKLTNTPADMGLIIDLCYSLEKVINKGKYDYVHLPIGSPVFMFVFAMSFAEMIDTTFVFSHSERKSSEELVDGKVIKRTVFEFKGFIEV
jgi:hypothetical protein